ncbi:hypothetical protein Tcan_11949 [Toxocara canis]|uniref:Transmembrane protein n=1 Tax=Toxocara canis TaxID=6265 RepID=A0A0B2VCL0_TOXCA|nr:hypothetical protein Tcan_11949 [Toxocara canis]
MMTEDEEPLLEGLHTVFVIVYLQEIAWIFTPLIISLNVLIHTFISEMDYVTRCESIAVAIFFLISGICVTSGLYLIHKKALNARQAKYFWPYVAFKLLRTIVLLTVASIILLRPDLRTRYFHISLYGIVESLSSLVAIEICYRSWRFMVRANRRKRRRGESDTIVAQSTVGRLRRSESLQESRELIAKIRDG